MDKTNTGLNIVSKRLDFDDHEMWTLHPWGGLCIGLAAPSSTGSNSQDPEKSLSLEVVWLMLEFGMFNDFLHVVRRILLHHALAPQVASALIRILEVFRRG